MRETANKTLADHLRYRLLIIILNPYPHIKPISGRARRCWNNEVHFFNSDPLVHSHAGVQPKVLSVVLNITLIRLDSDNILYFVKLVLNPAKMNDLS